LYCEAREGQVGFEGRISATGKEGLAAGLYGRGRAGQAGFAGWTHGAG